MPSLRWNGDFTLHRLRAQLARKYEFHPDAEPEYADHYKISLGKTILERKTMPAGFGVGGKTTMPVKLWRGPATGDEAIFGQDWSKGGGIGGGWSKPGSASSSTGSLSTVASTTALSTFYSPSRRASREELLASREPRDPQEPASRRLWREAHGAISYLKEFLAELAEAAGDAKDAKGKKGGGNPLAKAPVPGVQKALKDGGKLEWQNPELNGMTLLLRTARQGEMNLLNYLLALGAELSAVDWSRRSALHWAASEGHAKVVELILTKLHELGMGTAMVHARDLAGDTPLHLACLHGHLPVVKELCAEKRAGASPHVVNLREETPLSLAQKARMHHVVRYLTMGKPVAEDVKLRDMDRGCNDTIAKVVRLQPNPAAKKAPKKAAAKKK